MPPVEAPWTRSQIAVIERAEYSSTFSTNTEAGAVMSPTPWSLSVACAGTWNRNCHTTSLASRRRACAASFSPAVVAFFESSLFVALNVSSSPCMPPTRSCSASTACWVASLTGPGTSSLDALVDVLLLLLDQAAEPRLEIRLLEPRCRQERGEIAADLGRVRRRSCRYRSSRSNSCSACGRSSSPGPRR